MQIMGLIPATIVACNVSGCVSDSKIENLREVAKKTLFKIEDCQNLAK